MSDDTKWVHFISGEQTPTLRCRIFGHRMTNATAYNGPYSKDASDVEICRRCRVLKGASWEDVYKVET